MGGGVVSDHTTTAPTLDVASVIFPSGVMVTATVDTAHRITFDSTERPTAVEDAHGGENAGRILTLRKSGTQVWARWEAGRLCVDVRRVDRFDDNVWLPAGIRPDVRLIGNES